MHRFSLDDYLVIEMAGLGCCGLVGGNDQRVGMDDYLGISRCTGLSELTRKQVVVVSYLGLLIVRLHLLFVKGIVALASACGTDEIESAVVGVESTSLFTCYIGGIVLLHSSYAADVCQQRGVVFGIHGTDDLIGMVMSLQYKVDMQLFEYRYEYSTEELRLFVYLVPAAAEQVLVHHRYTPLGVRVLGHLAVHPLCHIVLQVLACTRENVVLSFPIVLMAIDEEQHIAIDKRIGCSVELRFYLCIALEIVICIEMVGIVQVGCIIVVAVGRHTRHYL